MQDPRITELEIRRMLSNEHPCGKEVQTLSESELLTKLYESIRTYEIVRMELWRRWILFEQEQARLRRIAWQVDKKLATDKIKTKKSRISREERKMREIRAFEQMLKEYLEQNPEILEELNKD